MQLKTVFLTLGTTVLSMGFFSCDNDDDPITNPNVNFTATLSGANEVPANPSTASGSSTATYNTDTKVLQISTTHNIAAPTGAHIHRGKIGFNGPVVFNFGTTLTSPILHTSVAFTAEQQDTLMANGFYVNVHTAAYPGGEIRGQLMKQ